MTKTCYRWMLAGVLAIVVISAAVYYFYFFEPDTVITEGTLVKIEEGINRIGEMGVNIWT